ncbi:hypothetical protein CDD81_5427 [Ophiocordyceps australis]|uniref:MIT domain-containing protein n=1 Tax=Ophiocordyceps australis TaxID=1399860 RepID=A0A2C5Y8V7_9HYPO|nr:hypothetical protein CDD81_5427 [Ophiocordyceps australis]
MLHSHSDGSDLSSLLSAGSLTSLSLDTAVSPSEAVLDPVLAVPQIWPPPTGPAPAPSQPSFAHTPARPPRTSSLLPPPNTVAAAVAFASHSCIDAPLPSTDDIARRHHQRAVLDTSVALPPKTFLLALSSQSPTDGRRGRPLGPRIPQPLRHPSDPPPLLGTDTMMSSEHRQRAVPPRGHSRSRSGKGSIDSTMSGGAKPTSHKAMLSRALQKANTAVQLDNAHNFEGARLAYVEACDLLHQILDATTGPEDKKKLAKICHEYGKRIDELGQIAPQYADSNRDSASSNKALPARPGRSEYQDALSGGTMEGPEGDLASRQDGDEASLQSSISPSPARLRSAEDAARRQSTSTQASISMPLTSGLPASAAPRESGALENYIGQERPSTGGSHGESSDAAATFLRDGSQSSWLDPIDESGGSRGTSLHSRNSSLGYRRRRNRSVNGNIETRSVNGTSEAEFDTALDAAIDAAYDDGVDMMNPHGVEMDAEETGEEIVSRVLRKVEMARERVRQSEREAYYNEVERRQYQQQRQLQQRRHLATRDVSEGFYEDNSSDEEERILEEMVRGYGIEDFAISTDPKMAASRPESRGLSAGAGPSPLEPSSAADIDPFSAKNDRPPTRGTLSRTLLPAAPPPTQSLPELPTPRSTSAQSVRNRRLSNLKSKQLKIETSATRQPHSSLAPEKGFGVQPKSASAADRAPEPRFGDGPRSAAPTAPVRRGGESPPLADGAANGQTSFWSPQSNRSQAHAQMDGADGLAKTPNSPSPQKLRKNPSATSLRSTKSRNMAIANIDDGSDLSPGTTSSMAPFGGLRTPALPTVQLPLLATPRDHGDGSATSGFQLLEDNFHMPAYPGSLHSASPDSPVPLEPCPNEVMLRPFWLMRCLYQTLVHPRGGYMSTKLFVPRDVWKVKGVKLKNIEDKVANCDLLTGALQRLSKVDTCDADAVLDEMQSFEGVLEQVQVSLSRKLGNEVGVQSSSVLFKDATNVVDGDGAAAPPRVTSVSNKSSFSWRRLRSKNSALTLANTYSNKAGGADGAKDVATMATVPMTTHPTSRPAKRDLSQAQFTGPNAVYLHSLARLFDAAQAVDQIARQVEDPGLRHADKTQVGLELCTRHAAEFFGFYICRFVITDLGLLLDKFIKRGSEWVLA